MDRSKFKVDTFARWISPARRGDRFALLALFGLVLLFFWKLAFTNLIIARGDIFYYFYPYRDYAAAALREGRIPLWNPYLFMGAPFVANSQVGFFYPFNLLMSWLDVTRTINWTIILHIFIAASGVYAFARLRLQRSILAAWLAAVSFGLGGYLGTQIEHVNQLQGLAWLGWIFLAYDLIQAQLVSGQKRSAFKASLILAALIAIQLLAGHTQSVFITLFGLGVYAIWPALELIVRQPRRVVSTLLMRLWPLLLASIVALALSAVQLLPTLELTQLSARSGGLPTNLAVSFSFDPRLLGRALLPDYSGALPAGNEFTAFFGVTALLLLVVGLSAIWSKQHPTSNIQLPTSNLHSASIVALLGLVLAFGGYTPLYYALLKVVPGFDLFRVPARWIVLFVFAGSLMVSIGLDVLRARRLEWKEWLLPSATIVVLLVLTFVSAGLTPAGAAGPIGLPDGLSLGLWVGISILTIACCVIRVPFMRATPHASRAIVLTLLVCLDLLLATRALSYNSRATAPDALTDLRPPAARLLVGAEDQAPPDRFLSISDIQFDPGDSAELQSIFGDQLSKDAYYDLIVATKAKEIIAPNMPLYYRLPAVDGYDGGVLPLRNYLTFQKLFLDPTLIQTDGRLREQLKSVPDVRWLNLMNVRYIITDKVGDNWYDGVLYDLRFTTPVASGQTILTDVIPRMPVDALGLIYRTSKEQGGLAQIEVTFADGASKQFTLSAGQAKPVGELSTQRVVWGSRRQVTSVQITGLSEITIRGLALIDQASGTFQSFVLAPSGRFRLVHSGDVKIYENVEALPRAFVVYNARSAPNDAEAIAAMQASDFDPSRTVIVPQSQIADSAQPAAEFASSDVRMIEYAPEIIIAEVTAHQEGYFVLTDAYYPGWVATVDDQPEQIDRADVLFRAVKISAGQHRIELKYQPQSFSIGAAISIAAWLLLIAGGLILNRSRVRQ